MIQNPVIQGGGPQGVVCETYTVNMTGSATGYMDCLDMKTGKWVTLGLNTKIELCGYLILRSRIDLMSYVRIKQGYYSIGGYTNNYGEIYSVPLRQKDGNNGTGLYKILPSSYGGSDYPSGSVISISAQQD